MVQLIARSSAAAGCLIRNKEELNYDDTANELLHDFMVYSQDMRNISILEEKPKIQLGVIKNGNNFIPFQ